MTNSLVGIAGVLVALCGCAPQPRDVLITAPEACQEGSTVEVSAEVKDGEGRTMPMPTTWSVDPPKAGSIEGGSLKCSAEGELIVKAMAGEVSATHKIGVTSPLVGTWVRRSDVYAGMKLRIRPAGTSALAGYIVGPPNDDALPAVRAAHKLTENDPRADARVACSAHVWAPGLKKWDNIARIDATRWSVEDLSKDIVNGCRENPAKSHYEKGHELTLVSPVRIERRDLKVAYDTQVWERIDDIDDQAIALAKAACEKARESATTAYAAVVERSTETQKQVSAKFWSGNGSLKEFQAGSRLVAALTSAQAALSKGAYAARAAGRLVPSDNNDPEIKTATEESNGMFNECKDVSP